MAVNRYNQAQPAQDNYFNTFVPLPLGELSAMGESRKRDLERNQAMIDKSYNDLLNIQAMPGKDEVTMKTQIIPAMTDIAMKYANVDLTQPQEMANLKREMRTKIDPNVINRIEQSHAGYLKYIQSVQKLSEEGKYNRQLDSTDYMNWDSANQGAFSASPEAYEGPDKLYGPLLNELKPSFKGLTKDGRMDLSVDQGDLARVALHNAGPISRTPAGKQQIRLFRMNYPNINLSDEEIIAREILDHGQEKIQDIGNYLSAEQMKLMGYNAPEASMPDNPLRSIGPGEVKNFGSFGEVKAEILRLKNSGDVEGGKDLEIKFNAALKKHGVSEDAGQTPDVVFNPTGQTIVNPRVGNLAGRQVEENKKVKDVLNDVASVTSNKTSFGSPYFPSKSLMDEDVATGKKRGPSEMIDISNNMITHPTNFELLSLNDKKVPKSKKLPGIMAGLNSDDMIDISMDILPGVGAGYKPVVELAYNNKKNGLTKVKVAINDPTQVKAFANLAAKRGDFETEAAILNPTVAAKIEHDNLDTPKTYHIKTGQGMVPIELGRNNEGGFTLSVPAGPRKPDGTFEMEPNDFSTRKEAIAATYTYMSRNKHPEGLDNSFSE